MTDNEKDKTVLELDGKFTCYCLINMYSVYYKLFLIYHV